MTNYMFRYWASKHTINMSTSFRVLRKAQLNNSLTLFLKQKIIVQNKCLDAFSKKLLAHFTQTLFPLMFMTTPNSLRLLTQPPIPFDFHTAHNSPSAHLVFLVHLLHVNQIFAIVSGGGSREVIFDPLQLRLGIKSKLVPLQRLLQSLFALRYCWLQLVKPVTRAMQG